MISPALFPLLAQTSAPTAPGLFSNPIVPMLCVGIILFFGLFRPQQQRAKEQKALLGSLKTGDRVVTTGGIHGIVANIKDGATLSLKIADNVRIEVDKTAIATVEKDKEAAAA